MVENVLGKGSPLGMHGGENESWAAEGVGIIKALQRYRRGKEEEN